MASLAQRARAALETLSTVLVIVAASGLLWTMFFRQPPSASAAAPRITDVKEIISADHLTNVEGSGPIAIVEFSDFQCPFCGKHATETLPVLKKDLIDSGSIRYISLHLPLEIHPAAMPAAEAAECAAEQGKFWEMHAFLFEKTRDLPTANFVDYAKQLGMDATVFKACLNTEAALEKVKAHEAVAKTLRVDSTPTLFIGRVRKDGGVDLLRRLQGAAPANVLKDEVAKLKS